MARKQLYINGTGSGTYGIYISSDTYLNAPAIDYTEYAIPARDGALVQYNKRLNNVVRRFSCFIPNNSQANLDGFKKLLYQYTGYLQISSDYESDTYQLGYLAEGLTGEPFLHDTEMQATFEIYFSCKPQKYFKTNTSKSEMLQQGDVATILPRSNTFIQKLFSKLPTGAIPNDAAFLLFRANGSNNTTAVTSVTASVTGHTGFIAAVFGKYNVGVRWGFNSLIAYSDTGSIADTSSHTPSSASDVYLVIPAGVTGTLTSSIVRSSTYNKTATLGPLFTVTNSSALGLSYTLKYPQAVNDYTGDNTPICTFLRGKLAGETTFEGAVTVYGSALHRFFTANDAATLSVDVNVDSETYAAEGKIHAGSTYSNISEYVSIDGSLDGRADTLEVYTYYYFVPDLLPDDVEIAPRWWKV